jgi:hypothetical protein
MSRVLYHYATGANQELMHTIVCLFLAILSLQVPAVAGFEPANFES